MGHWQEVLQKIEHSGLSIAQNCKENGIKSHTVRYWKQKLVKQDSVEFVRIATDVPAQSMEIIYPSGVRMKLSTSIPIKDLKALLNV
jgi:transposase-like protein